MKEYVDIMFISLIVIVLSIIFIGYGTIYRRKSVFTLTILGFCTFLGIYQFFVSIFIYFKFHVIISTLLTIFLLIIGIYLFAKNMKYIKWPSHKMTILFLCYIVIMIIAFYNSTYALRGFDTDHYLTMVNEFQINDYLGMINYSKGTFNGVVGSQYDLQTYFSFWGIILKMHRIIYIALFDLVPINNYVFTWSSSIIFYTLNFSLFYDIINYFKVKKAYIIGTLFLFPLLFFSTSYYIEALAFYGNTYRTLIVGVLIFEMYKALDSKDYSNSRILLITIITSSLIATSSSGFFLSIYAVSILIFLLIRQNIDKLTLYISVLVLPIAQFALYYTRGSALIIIIAFYTMIVIYQCLLNNKYQAIFRKLVIISLYSIPITLVIVSFGLSNDKGFFDYHSGYDMVFDYFRFNTFMFFTINLLICSGFIIYMIKRNNKYFKCFLLSFILLYNPLTYNAITEYLTSVVFYRSLDILFNPFTISLFIYSLLNLHCNKRLLKKISIVGVGSIVAYVTYVGYIEYYHHYFVPEEDYNNLYKINNIDLDVSEALYNHINYLGIEDARVVSQFLEVKSYVPSIISLMDYNVIRGMNYYGMNNVDDELIRVFYPRINALHQTFYKKPDYTRACGLIEENKADFIIIDNRQNYLNNDNEYIYMNEEVEKCEGNDIVYTNNIYTLYYFAQDN